MCHAYQVGVIVPSSNVTMETEIPALLRARDDLYGEAFTFHSSRMRMQSVTREELERMDEQSERCAGLLADARCDVRPTPASSASRPGGRATTRSPSRPSRRWPMRRGAPHRW